MPRASNTPKRRSILRRLVLLAPLIFGLSGGAASAQTAPAKVPAAPPAQAKKPASTKKSHSVSGSPLDTLRSTHLWTETGPAKDFVRDSRPDPKSLNYAPLTGTDPERPKPRDAANVQALQAELERDQVVNQGKGGAGKKARKAAQ